MAKAEKKIKKRVKRRLAPLPNIPRYAVFSGNSIKDFENAECHYFDRYLFARLAFTTNDPEGGRLLNKMDLLKIINKARLDIDIRGL